MRKEMTIKYMKQAIHQPTDARNKIRFMTNVELLHVPAPGCHPSGVFWNKRM